MNKLTLKLHGIQPQGRTGWPGYARLLQWGQKHPCGKRSAIKAWCDCRHLVHSSWVGDAQRGLNLLPGVPSGLAAWRYFYNFNQVVQHIWLFLKHRGQGVLCQLPKIVLAPANQTPEEGCPWLTAARLEERGAVTEPWRASQACC